MKVAKVQDIANLADGSVIGEIRAQIKTAFPPKTGEGKYGPWRVQAVILKDATGEVRASFWIQDDLKQMVGQTVTIRSQASAKGLQGLTVQHNTHSNSNELKITEKAAIIDDVGAALDNYAPPVAASAKTPHVAAAANPSVARKRLYQQAQLYVECIKAANYIRDHHKLSDDHFQAVVASMYISADRAGLFACFPEAPVAKQPVYAADDIPMDFIEADTIAKKKDDFQEEVGW